mmetsp:Transcript_11409/g.25050  ORF Transcript_11409/g.25050 Transcript_11409/m.25050 type:complete len:80 (+) Transcript_11409:1052-1291(+)
MGVQQIQQKTVLPYFHSRMVEMPLHPVLILSTTEGTERLRWRLDGGAIAVLFVHALLLFVGAASATRKCLNQPRSLELG